MKLECSHCYLKIQNYTIPLLYGREQKYSLCIFNQAVYISSLFSMWDAF